MRPVSFRGFALNADGLAAAFDRSYQRPSLNPIAVRRQGKPPKVTGVEEELWVLPALGMLIGGDPADDEALRLGILRTFDTRAGAGAGALVVTDDDGGDERYLYAACQNLEQRDGDAGLVFVATLVAADEPYWDSVDATTDSTTQNVASGAFGLATNEGDLPVEPTLTFSSPGTTPNTTWKHRRFAPVIWPASAGVQNHPTELSDGGWNTAALMAGGDIAAASSVGVIVDGVEVDRWIENFNASNTLIWVNLDFAPRLSATLAAPMGTGALTEFAINEDISSWPPSGIVQIGDERFAYNGRDLYRRAFTGVVRAAYLSSAASHAAGATVEWIQHEIWVVSTPGTGVAKTADDSRKPMLSLPNSSNAEWSWDGFGSATEPERTAQWTPIAAGMTSIFTGDEQGAETDPYEVMGIAGPVEGATLAANLGCWQIYLPCGVSEVAGSIQALVDVRGAIEASADGVTWERVLTTVFADTDWESLGAGATGLSAAYRYLSFRPIATGVAPVGQLDAIIVTMQPGMTPSASISTSSENNFQFSMTLANNTTGEAISIDLLPGMLATDQLVLDTAAKTLTLQPWGRNVYGALRRDRLRPGILPLDPGVNTLQLTRLTPNAVTITAEWRARWYV